MLLAISGCASFTSPARSHVLDPEYSYWIDYDATRRGTVVTKSENGWVGCAEPAPDAAVSVIAKLSGELELAGKADAELSQNVVSLTEKTQMVLFLREAMFRLCELSLNTGISAAEVTHLYETVLKSALSLVEKDRDAIKLEQARLDSADQAQYVHEYLTTRGIDPEIIQGLLRDLP